jgi:polysaccharide export outer membrane protein
VRKSLPILWSLTLLLSWCETVAAQEFASTGANGSEAMTLPPEVRASANPVLQLGLGDEVRIEVFNRPEMLTNTYIADDGSVRVPLAGAVTISGLSPAAAAQRIEAALKSGQFLLDPHVTLTVVQSRSQRVSVLGEVRLPGRYPIESNTTVLDALALAGGATERSADLIYVVRDDGRTGLRRLPVNFKSVVDAGDGTPAVLTTLRAGDVVFVPEAPLFYVSGQVHAPASYRLKTGLTVVEAIALAGGVTERGSTRRLEIKRRTAAGKYEVISAHLTDKVQPEDVINVKERIF